MYAPQIKHRITKVSGLFNTTPAHPSLHVVWCPSFPSKIRILYLIVFCQMPADSLQPLEHSAPAQPPEPTVWGQLTTRVLLTALWCMAWQSTLPVIILNDTGLCSRINWNFPCQSLRANTISDWRWCQRCLCFLWWPQGTRYLLRLYGQHVAFGQREPVWLLHTAFWSKLNPKITVWLKISNLAAVPVEQYFSMTVGFEKCYKPWY